MIQYDSVYNSTIVVVAIQFLRTYPLRLKGAALRHAQAVHSGTTLVDLVNKNALRGSAQHLGAGTNAM